MGSLAWHALDWWRKIMDHYHSPVTAIFHLNGPPRIFRPVAIFQGPRVVREIDKQWDIQTGCRINNDQENCPRQDRERPLDHWLPTPFLPLNDCPRLLCLSVCLSCCSLSLAGKNSKHKESVNGSLKYVLTTSCFCLAMLFLSSLTEMP